MNPNHDNAITPSFLAPTKTHSFASSKIILRRIGGGALLCRKTQAIESCQMVH